MSLIAGVSLLLALESGVPAPASAPVPKAEILGLWKGSSTCTKVQAAEFCNDETVVYNFVDVPDQPATVSLKAAKIVDGTLVSMYAIYFTYRPEEHRWTSEYERPRTHGIWSYVIHGDEMTGSVALLPELTVVRNVTAKRVAQDQVLPH